MDSKRGKSGSYSHCVLQNLPPRDSIEIKLTKKLVNFRVGITVLWALRKKENDSDIHQTLHQFITIAKGRKVKKAALLDVINGIEDSFPKNEYPITSEAISSFLSKKRKRTSYSPLIKGGLSRF